MIALATMGETLVVVGFLCSISITGRGTFCYLGCDLSGVMCYEIIVI